MKTVLKVFLLVLFGSAPVFAHPGHDEPVTQDAAVQRASSEVARLVAAGKLDKSWKLGATLQSAELKASVKGKEWAVVYSNSQAPNESERTLYVFLSESGEYLAANFSGR